MNVLQEAKPVFSVFFSGLSLSIVFYAASARFAKLQTIRTKPLAKIDRLAETELPSLSEIHNIFTSSSLVLSKREFEDGQLSKMWETIEEEHAQD